MGIPLVLLFRNFNVDLLIKSLSSCNVHPLHCSMQVVLEAHGRTGLLKGKEAASTQDPRSNKSSMDNLLETAWEILRKASCGEQNASLEPEEEKQAEKTIIDLPGSLLGRLWPAERVLVGMRACKYLRAELAHHASDCVMVCAAMTSRERFGSGWTADKILKDLRSLQGRGTRVFLNGSSLQSAFYPQLQDAMALALPNGLGSLLVELDLSSNAMGDDEAEKVADMLEHCQVLSRLNLRDNCIKERGASALGRGLRGCMALAQLDVSENKLGASAVRELGKALSECKELTDLDMSENHMGDKAAAEMVKMMRECCGLRR
eukprot:CAMPEP_0181320520 /NCGR_PEP_ID=MMETSP1101-20121128/18168_1 /TAXON_ID=46948 /ORGANISM="Rhodomonas abbreviata, Strain Caron Lab Isolate" /LENGTH=318 /DNA_ID=CAMNT_0023428231 /DNA_START=54 /DNA_END=1007 /DNA_ORIENTATION=+